MALLTDIELEDAIQKGEISIEPFEKKQLKGASYDFRLGDRAIVSRTLTLEELKRKVQTEEVKEIGLRKERSLRIPGGAFALVTTLERIRLGKNYAGHIGMRTYYVRKGLLLLSGLQIDPGWDAHLILGLANVSPRSIYIDHGDSICSVEVHRLHVEAGKTYEGPYMAEQREGKIPTSDKDYLRTIETMSVSDLTQAMYEMSTNISNLTRAFWYFWIPVGLTFLAVIIGLLTRLFS